MPNARLQSHSGGSFSAQEAEQEAEQEARKHLPTLVGVSPTIYQDSATTGGDSQTPPHSGGGFSYTEFVSPESKHDIESSQTPPHFGGG